MASALALRFSLSFRLIRKRPELSVVLVPSTPMKEDRLSTSGSLSTASAKATCLSAMAENEIDCDASVMPWIRPVSCTGKKPLGTMT